jgi:hypothetical protein
VRRRGGEWGGQGERCRERRGRLWWEGGGSGGGPRSHSFWATRLCPTIDASCSRSSVLLFPRQSPLLPDCCHCLQPSTQTSDKQPSLRPPRDLSADTMHLGLAMPELKKMFPLAEPMLEAHCKDEPLGEGGGGG